MIGFSILWTVFDIGSLSLKRLDRSGQHYRELVRVLGGVPAVFSDYMMMAMNRILPRDPQVHLLIVRAFEFPTKSADREHHLTLKHNHDRRTDEI